LKPRILAGLRLSLLFLFAVLLCSAATGCCLFSKSDAAFIAGVDAGVNGSGLLDEYDAYIEADPKIKPETKKIRHDTAAGLRKLIKDAQAK
jgi:hypothetical protein